MFMSWSDGMLINILFYFWKLNNFGICHVVVHILCSDEHFFLPWVMGGVHLCFEKGVKAIQVDQLVYLFKLNYKYQKTYHKIVKHVI